VHYLKSIKFIFENRSLKDTIQYTLKPSILMEQPSC